MEVLFWVICFLWIIVFVHMVWKITKYEKAIKQYMETDINQLYQENKKLKIQVRDLFDALDDIQDILDDFEEYDEKSEK